MSRQVAGALIFDPHGRIFVQRRSPERNLLPNCWDIVGGHLEPGETSEEAMRREVAEETGWEIDTIHGSLDPIVWTGDDGEERVEIDYLVSVKGDLDAPRLEVGKHTQWRWLAVSELALVDQDGRYGDQLIRELIELGFAKAQELGLTAPETGDLSVARFAAAIAPVIDRLFLSVMQESRPRGREALTEFGLTAPCPLIDYRMILVDRPLSPSERDAINRYADPAALHQGFVDYQSTGAVTVAEDGTVTATELGKAFLHRVWAIHDDITGQRFTELPALAKVLQAASPGPAFSAVHPSWVPNNASPGLITFTQLNALRYHRSDAHAAARAAHNHTPLEFHAAVEADTNRRAGLPYGVLTPDERFDLLSQLARW